MAERKKTVKKPIYSPEPVLEADLERLRGVTRRLLGGLEEALTPTVTQSEEQLKHQERLFGGKQSLVATLVTLSDLLLKLNQATREPELAEEIPMALSPADVSLVQTFIARMKTA